MTFQMTHVLLVMAFASEHFDQLAQLCNFFELDLNHTEQKGCAGLLDPARLSSKPWIDSVQMGDGCGSKP